MINYEEMFEKLVAEAYKNIGFVSDAEKKANLCTQLAKAIACKVTTTTKTAKRTPVDKEALKPENHKAVKEEEKVEVVEKDEVVEEKAEPVEKITKKTEDKSDFPAGTVWDEVEAEKFKDEIEFLLANFADAEPEQILDFVEEATDGTAKVEDAVNPPKSLEEIESVEDLARLNIYPKNILMIKSYAEQKLAS